jgi:hypothetical protein
MDENKSRDPMPDETATIEEIITFWDTHSTVDYEDQMEDVDFEMAIEEERYIVRLLPELASVIGRKAKAKGVTTETLINIWLAEKAELATTSA